MDTKNIIDDAMSKCPFSKWGIGFTKKAYELGVNDAAAEFERKKDELINAVAKQLNEWQKKMYDGDQEVMSMSMIEYIKKHIND